MPPDAGYTAARDAAILIDESSDRGRILVSGADRRTYLHAMLTNDIAALTPGRGCYAAYLTPQGRMVTDMRVLDLGDVLLLDVVAGVKDALIEKLDQFIFSEDVVLGDVTSTVAQLGVHGPKAAQAVARVIGEPANQGAMEATFLGLPEYGSVRFTLGDAPLIVAASGEFAPVGLDVYIEQTAGEPLKVALERAGAVPVGRETAEVLRVERGRPLFGRDMDQETIPLEASIEPRAVSFTKGCYPGQEVIVRILHRGHGRVARKLVGLILESDQPVPAGARVQGGDREAGHATVSVYSPACGSAIALAYVHRDLATPGTRLAVGTEGQDVPATVTGLPFVDNAPEA